MLVVMQNHATQEQIDRVVKTIEEMGYAARPMPGETRIAIGLVGNDGRVDSSRVEALPGVAEIIHVSKPYKQVSREWREENTLVTIAPGVTFGGNDVQIIAGPCSVESEEQIIAAAHRGARRRRHGAARRRVQAAQLPVRVSGTRQEGTRAARAGAARDGSAGRDRGARRRGRAPRGRVRRLHSDRRAKHAELFPAPRRRSAQQARAAQARHGGDDHRACS